MSHNDSPKKSPVEPLNFLQAAKRGLRRMQKEPVAAGNAGFTLAEFCRYPLRSRNREVKEETPKKAVKVCSDAGSSKKVPVLMKDATPSILAEKCENDTPKGVLKSGRGGRAKAIAERDLIRNKPTVALKEPTSATELPKSKQDGRSKKPAVASTLVDSLLPSSDKPSGSETGESTDAVLDHALHAKKTDRTPKASGVLSEKNTPQAKKLNGDFRSVETKRDVIRQRIPLDTKKIADIPHASMVMAKDQENSRVLAEKKTLSENEKSEKNTAGEGCEVKQCDSNSVDPSSDHEGHVVVNDPGKTGYRPRSTVSAAVKKFEKLKVTQLPKPSVHPMVTRTRVVAMANTLKNSAGTSPNLRAAGLFSRPGLAQTSRSVDVPSRPVQTESLAKVADLHSVAKRENGNVTKIASITVESPCTPKATMKQAVTDEDLEKSKTASVHSEMDSTQVPELGESPPPRLTPVMRNILTHRKLYLPLPQSERLDLTFSEETTQSVTPKSERSFLLSMTRGLMRRGFTGLGMDTVSCGDDDSDRSVAATPEDPQPFIVPSGLPDWMPSPIRPSPPVERLVLDLPEFHPKLGVIIEAANRTEVPSEMDSIECSEADKLRELKHSLLSRGIDPTLLEDVPSDDESNSPAVENDQPSMTKELVEPKNSVDVLHWGMRYPTKKELAKTLKRMDAADTAFKLHVPPLLRGFMAVDKFRYEAALRFSENKSDGNGVSVDSDDESVPADSADMDRTECVSDDLPSTATMLTPERRRVSMQKEERNVNSKSLTRIHNGENMPTEGESEQCDAHLCEMTESDCSDSELDKMDEQQLRLHYRTLMYRHGLDPQDYKATRIDEKLLQMERERLQERDEENASSMGSDESGAEYDTKSHDESFADDASPKNSSEKIDYRAVSAIQTVSDNSSCENLIAGTEDHDASWIPQRGAVQHDMEELSEKLQKMKLSASDEKIGNTCVVMESEESYVSAESEDAAITQKTLAKQSLADSETTATTVNRALSVEKLDMDIAESNAGIGEKEPVLKKYSQISPISHDGPNVRVDYEFPEFVEEEECEFWSEDEDKP